jgi:hypothetical protein
MLNKMAQTTLPQIVRGVCLMALLSILLAACAPAPTKQTPFKDFGYQPPASEYNGPIFKLSQDYPTIRPRPYKLPPMLDIDFTKTWRPYLMSARDYCLEGNVDADWRVENNKVRKWYHAPWLDYGVDGREAIRGLTRETPLSVGQLAATQTYNKAAAYALAVYNEFGGFTIGRVWQDHNDPEPNVAANEGFPFGTVACKLIFVSMPADLREAQVPYLQNPILWQAYAYDYGSTTNRKVQDVALLQMDIMVRDSRARYGWVFGTFQYNGALNNKNPWDNLVPIGMQWGNNPEIVGEIPVLNEKGKFPAFTPVTTTPINDKLTDTRINPDADLPVTHLGWGGRLNGPADSPWSSCFSCHMTASYPEQPMSGAFVAAADRPVSGTLDWDRWWMQWFQNNPWPRQFYVVPRPAANPPAINSLDFSWQLSLGIRNFYASLEPVTATATSAP